MGETPPRCVVRTATDGDLVAIIGLHHAQSGPAMAPMPDRASARQRSTWERMKGTADLTVYVAERDGEVVGNTCLLVLPNLTYDCAPTAFIEPMLVAAAHRRQGVGRLMVERVLADARAAACHKVQLLSHKRHATDGAHDFYRALGFEPEAEGFRLYLGA